MPTSTFFNLPEEKQSRIENAVYRVYTSMPYSKVSISAIVAQADIPRGSFYQYFADLDDLYVYFFTRVVRELIEKMYQEGIVDFWYANSGTLNYESVTYYLKKKEGIIGKLKNDFVLSIYGAPEDLRNRICIANAVDWSADMILERMRESFPHVPQRDLEILAFLYSMGDLLEKKFLDWKSMPLEEASYFSGRMLQMIFGGLKTLEAENHPEPES